MMPEEREKREKKKKFLDEAVHPPLSLFLLDEFVCRVNLKKKTQKNIKKINNLYNLYKL